MARPFEERCKVLAPCAIALKTFVYVSPLSPLAVTGSRAGASVSVPVVVVVGLGAPGLLRGGCHWASSVVFSC